MRIPLREMTNEMSVFILQSNNTTKSHMLPLDFRQDLDIVIFLQSKVRFKKNKKNLMETNLIPKLKKHNWQAHYAS